MSVVKAAVMFAMYAHYGAGNPADIPTVAEPPIQEVGLASWYGDGSWHGDQTANGEVFEPEKFTCAHRTLPFDSVVLIVNKTNRRRVWCRINDRGPYGARFPDGSWGVRLSNDSAGDYRGIIDMSIATARELGTLDKGLQQVELRYYPAPGAELFNLAAIDLQYDLQYP